MTKSQTAAEILQIAVGLGSYPAMIGAKLQIFATLSVTTATGGRSFSALKLLKNNLQSTMTQDLLNDLAHLYINRTLNWNMARSLKSLERIADA